MLVVTRITALPAQGLSVSKRLRRHFSQSAAAGFDALNGQKEGYPDCDFLLGKNI
jgi:hypothetical protein